MFKKGAATGRTSVLTKDDCTFDIVTAYKKVAQNATDSCFGSEFFCTLVYSGIGT